MSLFDRHDGKRVKGLDGVHSLMPHLKPHRCDADVYINQKFDVTNLVEYYAANKDKEITYFHLFATAIAKLVYNRPLLNRFIINKHYYDRNNVTLSFVAKTEFNDDAKESLTVLSVVPNDNLNTISTKIKSDVKAIRSDQSHDTTNDTIDIVGKLPKFLKAIVWQAIKFLDNHDLLPESLTKNSIYHATVLLSNLGSIKCGSIYHNLTDFGTNSILVTIGEIKEEITINEKGKKEKRFFCDFGINTDERIADGYYFVKSLKYIEYLFNNPKLLEGAANDKVDIKTVN